MLTVCTLHRDTVVATDTLRCPFCEALTELRAYQEAGTDDKSVAYVRLKEDYLKAIHEAQRTDEAITLLEATVNGLRNRLEQKEA